MPVLKYEDAEIQHPAPGIERRLVYLDKLLTAVLDFSNGPQTAPDPMHAHVHEQTTYVAAGEILFFMDGEQTEHLKAGDLFYVPSNRLHGIQLLTEKVRLIDSFSPLREDFILFR
ncbi:cupin domain-containing protein [Pedobacter sp. HDW13]|uniref:cupin domain-containing protein n=1 Tax=Pedobacter sp. HDW13 TaxID=2714940 RepID=UPI001408AC2C|nr:cupin domain-containing protein [Pedobacter sp. HDW13]QIL37883.1 cupin domain-containing protein [Pedobacter sp. HDW13]